MFCPVCGCNTTVIHTDKSADNAIRRVRQCKRCSAVFETVETHGVLDQDCAARKNGGDSKSE